jgi:hypothetical protein
MGRCVGAFGVLCVVVCLLVVMPGPAQAQEEPKAAVVRGQEYYEQSRFDEAIALMRNLVDQGALTDDDLLKAREILARSYVKKGNPAKAKEMFKAILGTNPKYRPDPIRVPPDETALFEQALQEYENTFTQSRSGVRTHPWHVGAQVGLSSTNIHGDLPDIAHPDYKLGFQGGGFVEYARGRVALDLELTYVQKGAVFTSELTDSQGNFVGLMESRLQLNYLEIPVMVRVPLPIGAVESSAVIGPTLGVGLGAKVESDDPSAPSRDLSGDLEPLDLGGTIGLGARFGSGPNRLLVEARYFTGFSDLWDLSGNLGSINHGFGLTVGVVH